MAHSTLHMFERRICGGRCTTLDTPIGSLRYANLFADPLPPYLPTTLQRLDLCRSKPQRKLHAPFAIVLLWHQILSSLSTALVAVVEVAETAATVEAEVDETGLLMVVVGMAFTIVDERFWPIL